MCVCNGNNLKWRNAIFKQNKNKRRKYYASVVAAPLCLYSIWPLDINKKKICLTFMRCEYSYVIMVIQRVGTFNPESENRMECNPSEV